MQWPANKIVRGGVYGIIVVTLMTLGWLTFDTTFHATGDYTFCTGCHSHKPIGQAYIEDLHGGNNTAGWRATCSQCHIPQDNALHYLWVKGVHGVVDPTMEILKDSYDIDWHGNRERREHYVYDSGCLSCHVYLQEKSQASSKAFLPHRKYFAASTDMSCVSCHQHVGHSQLGNHLENMGWEKTIEQ